jgi:biotin operon repressor
MRIEDYLHTDKFMSRHELMDLSNLSDRAVRREISDLKLKKVVLYSSQQKGYRLAKRIEDLHTLDDVATEYAAVQHCINDINARKEVFNQQLRCYIAYQKRIEKLFNGSNVS